MTAKKIHIVGGGLVGALTAIVLAERGFGVALYERRGDMRKGRVEAGRSINLAVTSRGLKALSEVGLIEQVLSIAVPMKGRMLHDLEGKTTFVPYGQKESEVIHSVSRGELNRLLLEKAGSFGNVELLFNHRCTDYDAASAHFVFADEESGRICKLHAPTAIATDGAGSVVRKAFARQVKGFRETQNMEAHGYKELVIPAATGGGFAMEKNALHIWPRRNYMLIALPNQGGSFTVTLFLAHEGKESFAALKSETELREFFTRVFPDAAALMPTLARDFVENPTGSMATLKCRPWHMGGKIIMLGDAAHAIVPFFGQGMNCGFEDASALGALLDKGGEWDAIFGKLEEERKPNADAIADMAVENFVEMRDTVADPKFQLKKQIGFELERRYPGKFIPRYAMVVFHPEIPYAEAKSRSEAQEKILDALAEGVSSVGDVDWQKAGELVGRMKAA